MPTPLFLARLGDQFPGFEHDRSLAPRPRVTVGTRFASILAEEFARHALAPVFAELVGRAASPSGDVWH